MGGKQRITHEKCETMRTPRPSLPPWLCLDICQQFPQKISSHHGHHRTCHGGRRVIIQTMFAGRLVHAPRATNTYALKTAFTFCSKVSASCNMCATGCSDAAADFYYHCSAKQFVRGTTLRRMPVFSTFLSAIRNFALMRATLPCSKHQTQGYNRKENNK